jgi:hypothetical protein
MINDDDLTKLRVIIANSQRFAFGADTVRALIERLDAVDAERRRAQDDCATYQRTIEGLEATVRNMRELGHESAAERDRLREALDLYTSGKMK